MRSFRFILLVVPLALNAFGTDVIRIQGSDALGVKLVPMLCELYRTKHPELTFDISAEGSSTAFAALLNGSADIGMSSREPKNSEAERFSEKGIRINRYIATIDSVAIVVNSSNPVRELSRKQIEAIFTGDLVDWSDVGGPSAAISVYARNRTSASFSNFKQLAMSGRDYAKTAIIVTSSELPSQRIEGDKLGVSYVGLAYANCPGIISLRIEGYVPGEREYPYRWSNYYFTRDDARQSVRHFLEWATRSNEALAIISQIGFLQPQK